MEKEDFYIWRYMDFYKFLDIVENKVLFFTFKKYFKEAVEGEENKFTFQQKVNELFHIAFVLSRLYSPNAKIIINKGNNCDIAKLVGSTTGSSYIIPDPEINARKQLNAIQNSLDKIGISCWTMEQDFNSPLFKIC